ncbi:hypothetical protein HXX02_03445 [Microbulbifer elongatus]|uniref:Glycine-rich protein n=1 Tax=Microbulbifer elongatus TaxID=86173 RepID=A0ABT1NX70_9GAMM|nr:hypothetical protein [Microbulbifer elongatus]MCQ3828488.1 hypothetical protein [Microbulbifer elongatus]
MKLLYSAVAFTAITAASGCASTPKAPPVFSESFITNITPQGNHLFTYTATLSADNPGGGRGPGGGGRGGRGGMGGGPGGGMGGSKGGGMGPGAGGGMPAKMRENSSEAAMERLEQVLAATSYCPHGWFIIEKTADRSNVEVKGECRAR